MSTHPHAQIIHELSNTLANIVSLAELHTDDTNHEVSADMLIIKASALKAHSLALKLARIPNTK